MLTAETRAGLQEGTVAAYSRALADMQQLAESGRGRRWRARQVDAVHERLRRRVLSLRPDPAGDGVDAAFDRERAEIAGEGHR